MDPEDNIQLPIKAVNMITTHREKAFQKGKGIPVTDTFITDTLNQATPMNPGDGIQLPIRKANMITTHISTCISTCILMSVQPQDSLSNKLD